MTKEHTNEAAEFTWILGIVILVFFILVTSLIKCFCARVKPIRVDSEPTEEKKDEGAATGQNNSKERGDEEEVKVDMSEKIENFVVLQRDSVNKPGVISGGQADDTDHLKATATDPTESFKH